MLPARQPTLPVSSQPAPCLSAPWQGCVTIEAPSINSVENHYQYDYSFYFLAWHHREPYPIASVHLQFAASQSGDRKAWLHLFDLDIPQLLLRHPQDFAINATDLGCRPRLVHHQTVAHRQAIQRPGRQVNAVTVHPAYPGSKRQALHGAGNLVHDQVQRLDDHLAIIATGQVANTEYALRQRTDVAACLEQHVIAQ